MNSLITNQIEQEFAYVDSIITAHTNATIAKVNAEALQTYWEIGEFVSQRLKSAAWGDHVVSELADYLKRQNPKRRGYSKRNIYNMVQIFDTYVALDFQHFTEQLKLSEFVQSQPTQIPMVLCLTTFTHHIEILHRCRTYEEYVFYLLYSAHQQLKVEELRAQ